MRIGEILDRAIDLSVKRFPTLAAILALYEILGLVLTVRYGRDFSVYGELAERLGFIASAHGTHAHSTIALVFALALEFVLGPIAYVALFISISSFYLSKRSSIVEAYRAAGGIVGAILYINVFYEIPTFVVFLASDEATRRIAASPRAFELLPVIFGGVFVLSSLGFAGSLNWCAVAFERTNVGHAIWKTLRRLSAPNRLIRSFVSLIFFGLVWIGSAFVHDTVWSLLPKYHVTSSLAIGAVASLFELVEAIFMSAFTVIFYYDIRVREEAFDLHVEIDALEQRAASIATA